MNEDSHNIAPAWRSMSPQDLALWGVQDVAFVKLVEIDGQEAWSIHSADGNNIGMAPSREVAFAAVSQYDLEPVSVH